ncbi:uncharacterized protein LOC135806254 [Sycon ciliatum]|uniref:uncharacterized protein LOC135806254 n=1 Tax=Sycon ciliatum TaxID=27933 RepID=UPI0020AC8B4E
MDDLPESPSVPQYDNTLRKEIRQDYRALQSDVHRHRHELVQSGNVGLIRVLDKAGGLFTDVEAPLEAVLDSKILRSVASMGVEQARNVNASRIVFNLQDMAKKCVGVMNGALRNLDTDDDSDANRYRLAKLDWSKLADVCAPCLVRRTPSATFMYGPLTIQAKERRQGQKRPADKTNEKVMPTQVESANQHHEETTEEVERVARVLKDVFERNPSYEAIPYFDFVLNPDSFSQSVENIFHTAFLVKDNIAFIKFSDQFNEPYIGLTTREDANSQAGIRRQFIVELDMQLWTNLVEVYEIIEPCIPTRSGGPDT